MKIRYNATGVEDHVSNELGRALINTGQAVQITDTTAPGAGPINATPKWFVEVKVAPRDRNRRHLVIRLEVLGRVEFFSGKPEWLNDRWFGRPVPIEIAREYARQYEAHEELRDKYALIAGVNKPDPENEAQASAKREADARVPAKFDQGR
jgi:hypothetical protein